MENQPLTPEEEDALLAKADAIRKARARPRETALTRALTRALDGLHPKPREELISRWAAGEYELWKYRRLNILPSQEHLDPNWRQWLESKYMSEADKEWVPFFIDLISAGDYEIHLILRGAHQS